MQFFQVYESISYQYNDIIVRLLNESGTSWTITIVGKILLQHADDIFRKLREWHTYVTLLVVQRRYRLPVSVECEKKISQTTMIVLNGVLPECHVTVCYMQYRIHEQ